MNGANVIITRRMGIIRRLRAADRSLSRYIPRHCAYLNVNAPNHAFIWSSGPADNKRGLGSDFKRSPVIAVRLDPIFFEGGRGSGYSRLDEDIMDYKRPACMLNQQYTPPPVTRSAVRFNQN